MSQIVPWWACVTPATRVANPSVRCPLSVSNGSPHRQTRPKLVVRNSDRHVTFSHRFLPEAMSVVLLNFLHPASHPATPYLLVIFLTATLFVQRRHLGRKNEKWRRDLRRIWSTCRRRRVTFGQQPGWMRLLPRAVPNGMFPKRPGSGTLPHLVQRLFVGLLPSFLVGTPGPDSLPCPSTVWTFPGTHRCLQDSEGDLLSIGGGLGTEGQLGPNIHHTICVSRVVRTSPKSSASLTEIESALTTVWSPDQQRRSSSSMRNPWDFFADEFLRQHRRKSHFCAKLHSHMNH